MTERIQKLDDLLGNRYRETIAGQLTNDATASHCLYTSRVYLLERLQNVCQTYLAQNRRIKNVSRIFSLAYSLDIPELRKLCLEYMSEESEDVLRSHSVLDISRGAFHYLLGREDFLADEVMLFHAAARWAVKSPDIIAPGELKMHASKIREKLDSGLYNIRFPVVPSEFLDSYIRHSGILTPEELKDINQLFINRERAVEILFKPVARTLSDLNCSWNEQNTVLFSCSINIKLHCLKTKYVRGGVFAIDIMKQNKQRNSLEKHSLKMGEDWAVDDNGNINFTKPILLKSIYDNWVVITTDPCTVYTCLSGITVQKIIGVKITATYFTDNFISAILSPGSYNPSMSSDESSEGSLGSYSLSPQLSLVGRGLKT